MNQCGAKTVSFVAPLEPPFLAPCGTEIKHIKGKKVKKWKQQLIRK